MRYITGMLALNMPCSLTGPNGPCTGDWHSASYKEDDRFFMETDNHPFGTWRVEKTNDGRYVADTIRACADLILAFQFGYAQGMRDDYIVTDRFDGELFSRILSLKDTPGYHAIDEFMEKEYKLEWINYCKNRVAPAAQKGNSNYNGTY